MKASIAPFKYPRAITFVDQLPKTATGKIQRFRMRGPVVMRSFCVVFDPIVPDPKETS